VSAIPAEIDQNVLVTADGYVRLVDALESLRTLGRAQLVDRFREAREDADPDNPLLFELLEEQAQLEARIGLLEAQVAAARVVEPAADGSAGIGSAVQVRYADGGELAEYVLVGPVESDAASGRVSVEAPVGRALLGARTGDVVIVETPRRTERLEILGVDNGAPPAATTAA
jgi:transcription elongation factor GreA